MNGTIWVRWVDSFSDNLKSKIQNPKWWGIFIIAFAFAFGGVEARAQQPKKIPRVGYLDGASLSAVAARTEAFRQGLRELGYIDGKNILIEWKSAEGKVERLPALAAELVRLKVAVIVTGGATGTRTAKQATTTIPIVMAQDPDPVENGFVASLARPGGNITGLSTLAPELSGKQMELLKEIAPKLSRVAVLGDSNFPGNAEARRETELAAGAFKVQLQYLDVRSHKDIEALFRAASKESPDAVLLLSSSLFFSQRTNIAQLASKTRLPVMYYAAEFVEDGGLMCYAASRADSFRRAATFVDKILKGTNPADLPIEQPTKFELIINLKAAKQIGLTIPATVLARADRVIR
jgi:putative tryptophan/tyrosine transport system substrate-binding protein